MTTQGFFQLRLQQLNDFCFWYPVNKCRWYNSVWFKFRHLFLFPFPFHFHWVIYVSVSFLFWRIVSFLFQFPFQTVFFHFSFILVLHISISFFVFAWSDAVIIRNKHVIFRHEKIKHIGSKTSLHGWKWSATAIHLKQLWTTVTLCV